MSRVFLVCLLVVAAVALGAMTARTLRYEYELNVTGAVVVRGDRLTGVATWCAMLPVSRQRTGQEPPVLGGPSVEPPLAAPASSPTRAAAARKEFVGAKLLRVATRAVQGPPLAPGPQPDPRTPPMTPDLPLTVHRFACVRVPFDG